MINKLKPKSEFSRNVLTLMTGTTIAQAIPVAISPILTRIYTPEDFGVFALFVAITSIFGSIANARYELAIMLPKKDEDAINIFALGFIITTVISLMLLILAIVFNAYFVKLLGHESIGIWLYFIPLSVFLIGLYNVLNYFNNRKKQYKDLAKATIIKAIVTATVQLSMGFMKSGASGLISGQLLSQIFANTKLLKNITKDKRLISSISKVKMIALAKRYKDFPKFSMWANLLNTSSVYATNILISSLYSISTLGFYSLVQRVLGMPSSLVGNAMGQVFFQESSYAKREKGNSLIVFDNTLKKLILISLPVFIFLFFFIEDIFTIVFGEKWEIAGEYAKILIPFYFVNFISSPLAITMTVYEKQKNAFFINMIIIICSVGVIVLASLLGLPFIEFLYLLSGLLSICYLFFILYYRRLSKG